MSSFTFAFFSSKNEILSELLYRGFYPPIHDQGIDSNKWYSNYIQTYIEKDVRQLKNIINLNSFERFIKLCAARTGQLLNLNNLANLYYYKSEFDKAELFYLEAKIGAFLSKSSLYILGRLV